MFLHHLVEFAGFELNHSWHGINVLSILECALLASVLCAVLAVFFGWRRRSNISAIAVVGMLSFATAAYAANTALSALSASGALAGANLIYVVQTAGTGGVKATLTQVATFINSLFSGDFTCTSGGACTLKNTGPGATGPIGSATVAPIVTVDAQGRVTALTSAGITQPTGANPSGTAGPTAVNGSAATFMRSDGAPAIQKATAAQFGVVEVDGTSITAAAGVITAVPGVTSRTVTSGPDTILSTDRGNIVYYNSASAIAITQPAPTGSFASGFFTTLCNISTGLPTVTPGSGNIGGAGTFALPIIGTAANPACAAYQSDGTNFNIVPDYILNAAGLTGTLADARLSSNVPLKNGAATITGVWTFGEVLGTIRVVGSGTTADTLAATDCGTEVTYAAASAVTVTIPQTLPTGCNIAILQLGAGKVSVNGTAVTQATLRSAHSYTGTAAQYSIIGINIEAAGTPAIAILTGDGA